MAAMIISSSSHLLLLLQTLIVFTIFLNLSHSQDDAVSFRFDNFDPKPNDATYQGDAAPYLGLLSLNPGAKQESVGRVLYSEPFRFWDPQTSREAAFDTTFTFYISRVGDISPAEGIAFFIAPANTTIPPDSAHGNLGVYPTPGLFAVEFDTSPQPWNGDPNFRHIGINAENRTSLAVVEFDDFFDQAVIARIRYRDGVLELGVNVGGIRYYALRGSFDLKAIVPQTVRVGISGATGNQVEYNYIRSWSFESTLQLPTNELRLSAVI